MIDETKAKEFALGIEDPSVPDGEKFKMATALDEYFKAEDLKVDKGIKKAFTSPSIEGVKIDDNIMAGYGTSPEEIATIKKGAANVAWLARREQKPIDHFNLTLPAYQDTYAQQYFKSPKKSVTDNEFYQLVSEDYKAQDNAHNLAFSAAARDLTADSAINEFNVGLTGSPVAGRMKDYHQSIGDLHLEYTQKLAPYRTIIDQAAKTVEGYDTKAEGVSDTFAKVAESLLPLPPKERLLVINAIGEVGAATPKEKQTYLQKLATAMDREVEKAVSGTVNLAESIFYSGAGIEMSSMNVPEVAKATAQYAGKRRELQILAGQVKMMAHNKISPIVGNNWWEETGIGVARMAPIMAATFINSPVSIAIMTGQFRDEATIEAVNAGASIENAEMVAFASAPIMAVQEFLSNAIPLGKIKIPFIDKWLKAPTSSIKNAAIRIATRSAIGTATEISEEIMQTVTPLAFQDALSEWQSYWSIESGISKSDWDERMPKISDIAKQTFGPALIVSFLMAGRLSIADVKNARSFMSSPDMMIASGIAPELANQITVEGLSGNYTEVDKLFRKGFDQGNKATPEQIQEAEAKLNVKASATLEFYNKLRKDYGLGTVANIGGGKYQFTTPILRDGKGEIIDSGISAQFNSLSEADEAQRLHLKNRQASIRKAEQQFITSMNASLEEKQGLDITLMDFDMFTKTFSELFPSTAAQVEERIKLTDQIDGAVEDVSLDNATLESEANDNKNYRILGTNSIEQREGISVGVITLYNKGSILDLIEENAEVGVKRLMSDPLSRTKLILQIRDVEAKMKDQAMQMGQKHMPLIATTDNDKVSNMEIIEAFSHIAKSYYVQTTKAVERPTFTSDMPLNLYLGSLQSSIAGMELKDAIDLVGEKTLNILYRAAQLKAIHDANGLNQDFIAALEKSVGLNVSNRNADAVVDTAAGIAADAGVTMSMGRAQPFDEGQTSFSLAVQTVAANILADQAGMPAILDPFFVGKKFLVMEADRTAAGGQFTLDIAANGGPGFVVNPRYMGKVGWASAKREFWLKKLNRAIRTDAIYIGKDGKEKFLVSPYLMEEDAHVSNSDVVGSKLSEVARYVDEGRITDKQEQDLATLVIHAAGSLVLSNAVKLKHAEDILILVKAQNEYASLKSKEEKTALIEKLVEEDKARISDIKKSFIGVKVAPKKGNPVVDVVLDIQPLDISLIKKNTSLDLKKAKLTIKISKQIISEITPVLNFPTKFSGKEMTAFVKPLTFNARGFIAEQLSSVKAENIGAPPMGQIQRVTRDNSYHSTPTRSLTSLIEIDVQQLREGLDPKGKGMGHEAFGVPVHGSYDTFVAGKAIVFFRTPIPYSLGMPQMSAELFGKGKAVGAHTFHLKVDGGTKIDHEVITPMMATEWNNLQTTTTNAATAQAVVSALGQKWISMERSGAAGLAEFPRALRNSNEAATLTLYTIEKVKSLISQGKMKVYRLGTMDAWFALKRPNNEEGDIGDPDKDWAIVGVVNNTGGAQGVLPLIMAKAISEGGTQLDCYSVASKKKPLGLLPTLYSRSGFQAVKTLPFDPQYHQEPGKLQDLKHVWETQSWDGLIEPPLVYMTYNPNAYADITADSESTTVRTSKANEGSMDSGAMQTTGAVSGASSGSMGSEGQKGTRGGVSDSASATGNDGGRAPVLPRRSQSLSSIITEFENALKNTSNDYTFEAWGVTRNDVQEAVDNWNNPNAVSFSVEKANRKNSLRVLLTKRALTDAALAQASWKDWYSEHKETLDEFFGDSAELFQKILSVTSQASSVKANVGLALKAFGQLMRGEEFDGKLRGEAKSGYLPAVISNLNAVKNNLVANGRKIANYTAANEGDLSRVVVDRHIARLLFGVDTPSKSQYDKAEKILTKIANEIGWSPSQVQAALWAYSIVKSGETPESYGAYLKKLESKPLTRKELKNGLTGNQLTKRIGNITRGGDGLASIGTGRGRYSSISPTFSISRSDFTGRIEQSLRPLFEGSPDAKLKIGMMALKRAQAISGEALYNVGRPGAAKRKLAEMEASRIAKLGKVTDKTPDWVKKSLEKETTPEQAKAAMLKDKLNGWIQLHDAIVSSMPTEIRGSIGSISTLVKLSSDEARLKFIEERIPKMEKAVERYLKKEYGERIDKMLESAAVKGKAGEIPKSKFIVTVQDELNTIIDMANLSADDTVKEAARYEAEIISAQTAEDAADALAKSQLLEMFGDLYGKQTTAEEMDVAHEYLKDLMTQGRNARKIIDEARAAEIAKMVEQAKADAFAGAANAATVEAGKNKGKGTTKGIMKGLLRELGSHRFVLSSIFGRSNKTADVFDERMILGVNAFETTQAARKKSLRDFMRALYGTKSKIKLDKELEKLETKVERSRVTYLSGEIRESDTKTVEEVAKIIKSPSTFGYSAEEAKLWEDEMDAWSNLPNARKRNLTIDRIKTPGTRIEIPLSQMEAVYMAMALRQPGILDQQSVHGYDHVTQTELEAFMSDDAKNWLAWFGAEYSAEYDTANEVFMKLFHTRMPQIQFYAPLLKNHQGNQASLDPLNSGVVSQSVNPGAVKSRRGRTSSLRIESALAVYQAHFVQMDYWVHMAEYLRDTQAVMLNADVQNAIKSGHGAEAMQTLSSWIQLEMSRGVGKGALVMHSSKLMRNLKSGVAMKALAFNIGTSIKTLSSVFYSLGEIPITRWPAAFTRGVEHWGKMWDTNIIQNRLELGGTPEIRHILANAGKSKNAILRLVENALVYGSVPTQYADAVLTSYSAAMVYGDRFAQAKDAGAGDDAAHKYAAREMEIAVSRTAQPNDWSGRSLIENDASGVFNLLSMFSSDPRQKLGLVGEAMMKWKRGGATNEETMRKVLAYWVIPGLMFQVANAVTRSLFKDDDKEWELDNFIRAAIVGPLQGLFLLGAAAEFFIASAVAAATEKLTGEKQDAPRNWRSSTNPMVDMSDQFLQSIKKLPENMENEDYLGGAWQIMKAGGAMVTPFSPAGSAPGIADRVFKDTSTLFYGKED
jgi:hypothetical protein